MLDGHLDALRPQGVLSVRQNRDTGFVVGPYLEPPPRLLELGLRMLGFDLSRAEEGQGSSLDGSLSHRLPGGARSGCPREALPICKVVILRRGIKYTAFHYRLNLVVVIHAHACVRSSGFERFLGSDRPHLPAIADLGGLQPFRLW